MDVLKKGLTASGNVAESHCIPVLAYSTNSLTQAVVRNQLRLQKYENKTKDENENENFFYFNAKK
jgi:hypothetical protein